MATKAAVRPALERAAGLSAAPGAAAGGVVATMGAGAVALPQDLMAELAQHAKNEAAKERPTVGKISLRNGNISYLDSPVPGNQMEIVILASAFRNVFYANSFDPDNVVNPSCFALSESGEEMVPHENVEHPVNPTCDGCPNMEWGSAPPRAGRPSRGKACKEGRRLVVMPADALQNAEMIKKAEIAIVDIPVTSVGNWATLVNVMSTAYNLPYWGGVVNMATLPNNKTIFTVNFTPVRRHEDEAIIRAIMGRRNDALRIAMTPWDETKTEEANVAAKAVAAKRAKAKY